MIAGIAIGHFVSGVKLRLGTGMTGFDSTWYHGPFAAGFFQSGNTIDLHFIAPQFLAWFYPANSEVVGAIGMLAFSRDLMSPLLNLGWLLGCLLACWCIGRPFRVAPWSLALGAIALSVPALADQAGEARNDIVGIFFLLAAVAIALNAAAASGGIRDLTTAVRSRFPGAARRGADCSTGRAALSVGLAIGLAAGTKLNFLLPAAVLVLGLTALAPSGRAVGDAPLRGRHGPGGRRLLVPAEPDPQPATRCPGSTTSARSTCPSPEQALGGREAHSVFSLPDQRLGLVRLVPARASTAASGSSGPSSAPPPSPASSSPSSRWPSRSARLPVDGPKTRQMVRFSARQRRGWGSLRAVRGVLALAGLVGLAAAVSWLVSPTSASGPDGMPRGFESGLRYLTPALILGLALLPTVPPLRAWAARLASLGPKLGERPVPRPPTSVCIYPRIAGANADAAVEEERLPRRWVAGIVAGAVLLAVVVGYPVQRHYLRDRYRDPSFTTPGLDAAFAWARGISGARIATTSTRQYPLFGTDLSNRVAYLGVERPHGGFEEAPNCGSSGGWSTKATTTTSSPPATGSKPASPPSRRRRSGSKGRTPKWC